MAQQFLEVAGNTIWLGSYEVGSINEGSPFFNEVKEKVNDLNTHDLEKNHDDEIREIEDRHSAELEEWEEKVDEKNDEIADLESEVTELEGEVSNLKEKLQELLTASGISDKIKEMEDHILELQEANEKLRKAVRDNPVKTKRKYIKKIVYTD